MNLQFIPPYLYTEITKFIKFMNTPKELKYTPEHEWVRIEGDVAIIGITDFAQSQLGDIIFVESNVDISNNINAGEVFGIVEAVKTVSDLFMPVSGEILEFNKELDNDPEKLNSDPYGSWIIKVKISDLSDVDSLLSSDDYLTLISE